MIKKFLTENTNKEIMLAKGMTTFTGILANKDNDFWMVGSQIFHISQISTCGNLDKPYVVVI